jgi:AhpD family alkylhydroperoxidase
MERISQRDLPEGLLQSLLQVQNYVDHSGLDPRIQKLVQFRVSQINSCAYCLDMHYKEALEMGENPLRLISLDAWRETPYYSPKEQAALAFAEELTHLHPEKSSDAIHEELSKHFSKKEIALLTLAIVQINSWNRITRSFGTTPGKYQVKRKMETA